MKPCNELHRTAQRLGRHSIYQEQNIYKIIRELNLIFDLTERSMCLKEKKLGQYSIYFLEEFQGISSKISHWPRCKPVELMAAEF